MFSEGIGATTAIPEDIGNQALDLGVPMYPIATNYKHRVRRFPFPATTSACMSLKPWVR
jgi:hypothetical protein